MDTWTRRHRPFLGITASSLVLVGGVLLLYLARGDELLRAGYEGRSIGPLNSLLRFGDPQPPWEMVREVARESIEGWLAVAIGLWALFAALWFAAHSRRPRLLLPCALLGVWLAFETVAPPFVMRIFRLNHYKLILDVDHIEDKSGRPDWNADSLRGTAEPESFREQDFNILFLGDSFTMGYRLKSKEAFPQRAGARLAQALPQAGVRVANFGWTSSSPLLSWRRLERIGERYHPDLVVLCLDMTDFADDLRYGAMIEKRGLYWLYDKLPIALKLFHTLAPDAYEALVQWSVGGPPRERFFVTEAPLEETRPWIEPLTTNVRRIHAWCAERGVDFVLVLLPRSYQYSDREAPENWEAGRYTVLGPYAHEPFRYFEELRDAEPYPIVSLLADFQATEVFPTCFEDDPHWNAEGAAVAAGAIARELAPYIEARIAR